ncbi:hypothetical protein Taro_045069, partial [Colocasia esculenta]|nr:hypothetical protein [Colocasia esculenta]
CAVDSQDEVRGKAIRLVANKLYPLSYVTENIEQFAKTMILSLMDEQVPDKEVALGTSDDQRSEAECQEASTSDSQLDPSPVERLNTKVAQSGLQSASAVSFTKAQQHSSLFFALCTKKPNLLQFVFDIYGRAPKAVKQSINWHAPDLVRKLGSSCPELLNIISNFPEGSENLLMLDAAIVIPILSSLSKEEVLPIFPRLVDLPMEKFQTALARILQGSAHTGPALTPTEVLVAIHDINPERDGVALKKVCPYVQVLVWHPFFCHDLSFNKIYLQIMEVCTTCFEQKTVFTQHVFVRALNELIERTTVPLLFMRTVIQAVDAFPSLIDFVMEILSKLVTKQVWRMPKLWPGFLKCASQTKPHSFPVLLQLPPTILENVLQKHAILKAPLATYANQAHIRSSLPRQVLEVLGSGNEQKQPSR